MGPERHEGAVGPAGRGARQRLAAAPSPCAGRSLVGLPAPVRPLAPGPSSPGAEPSRRSRHQPVPAGLGPKARLPSLPACALPHCSAVPAGARWDTQTGVIAEARLKELTPAMPVIFVKAIPVDRMETKNMYECPVYKTRIRGPTYVWTFNLKTKEKAAKWVLAAVALLLQV